MKEFWCFSYPFKKSLLLTKHIDSLYYSVFEKLIKFLYLIKYFNKKKKKTWGIEQILKQLINILCKKYIC